MISALFKETFVNTKTTTTTAKLSPVPTAEELEAVAGMHGETQVVGGSLISGGVQFGTYRNGTLVPADDLAQKVDYATGNLIKPPPIIEGAPMYVAEGKDPVKLEAKRQVRTKDRTQEEIDKANAMSEPQEAAQQQAEDAIANPPTGGATAIETGAVQSSPTPTNPTAAKTAPATAPAKTAPATRAP